MEGGQVEAKQADECEDSKDDVQKYSLQAIYSAGDVEHRHDRAPPTPNSRLAITLMKRRLSSCMYMSNHIVSRESLQNLVELQAAC